MSGVEVAVWVVAVQGWLFAFYKTSLVVVVIDEAAQVNHEVSRVFNVHANCKIVGEKGNPYIVLAKSTIVNVKELFYFVNTTAFVVNGPLQLTFKNNVAGCFRTHVRILELVSAACLIVGKKSIRHAIC